MKKYFLFIVLTISYMAYSQEPNNRPNVEEMHARKWQFMVEKAKLTDQEATKVQPIFIEYEHAVWKLMERNKVFFHKTVKEKSKTEKHNFQEMNDNYVNFEIQKAQLLKDYYTKLKKNLSAESIFKLYNAERSFRKELIKDWQKKGQVNRRK